MKTTQVILMTALVTSIAACKSTKNNTSSTAASPAPASAGTSTVVSTPVLLAKAANGVYAPGSDELSAIQPQYPDITLDKLNKGYSLYAESACIQCHQPKNIYRISDEFWKEICANMSEKAMISDEQKDAVYKYVLAVKASKVKSGK